MNLCGVIDSGKVELMAGRGERGVMRGLLN